MTDDNAVVRKVTALLTRRAATELLVFRHPYAGVQLPAGTVEPGESVEAAVVREVAEETGLQVSDPRRLGMWDNELADDETVLCRAAILHRAADPASPALARIARGATVPVRGRREGFVQVDYHTVVDGRSVTLTGWIPTDAGAAVKERHFFHMQVHQDTPARWPQPADEGHTFQLYWIPLQPPPALVAGQDRWLDYALARL